MVIFSYKDKAEMMEAAQDIGNIRIRAQFMFYGYFLLKIRSIAIK